MTTVVSAPFGDLWKVARVDLTEDPVTEEQQHEIYAWLDKLGLPYTECRPKLVVTQNSEDGRYLLHLARFVLDHRGENVVEYAENRVMTTPLVLVITEYPAWLVQASVIQDQAQKGDQGERSSAD